MNTNFQKKSISAEAARQMLIEAEQKAVQLGIRISCYIVDESGVLKAFSRMDNAALVTIDAARKKAVTAVGYGMPSGEAWYDHIKDDPILFHGVQQFQDFILLGGGLPVIIDGVLAGAIGISGGHYKQDEQCAMAALAVLDKLNS
jgi:uncharacterized protein GlcG (DUF336 family)